MTTSERARRIRPAEMPESDRPISEQWRIVAAQWVELDAAARLLEETKTSVLAEKISQHRKASGGTTPYNAAEAAVKASPEWMEFLNHLVDAKTKANRAKVQATFLNMKFEEWRSLNANARAERGMR